MRKPTWRTPGVLTQHFLKGFSSPGRRGLEKLVDMITLDESGGRLRNFLSGFAL